MEKFWQTLLNYGSGIAAAIGAAVSKFLELFNWASCSDAELIKKLTLILLFCQLIHTTYRVVNWALRGLGILTAKEGSNGS